MTEQQDRARRFAEEPTVTREQFVEASELAGIRYLDHEEAVRVCAFAVQQEKGLKVTEEALKIAVACSGQLKAGWDMERARAESLERRDTIYQIELRDWRQRTEQAEAVVAQVREFLQGVNRCSCHQGDFSALDEIVDAAAPDIPVLDGSSRAAVRLLTGFSDEKLNELGGFSDDAPAPEGEES